ncbi:hypothetical protein QVD17_01597 [Tagetes erecta]|uniref:non-specific serine/threonine protein kinase n=1 Tax=Tagetes erecta TaxID=13708 RepID=A0AAD8P8A0_TARER|nr:hypothetical protein QVD17_01597 [Tagetes erecta]
MASLQQFEHLKIQLKAILVATNNFSDDNCIGRGGFGNVYKGELANSTGKTTVALKRLDRAFGQGDPEFWKEIMMLSFYRHENIVSLLGYCDNHGEKILVYEYASKKSLDSYLASNHLSWVQRLKICVGAARGLAYLHTPAETQLRIVHRDIKSSNILLDDNWNAMISDFGLSKFAPANNLFTFMVSNPVGTPWYIDPLYHETGLLTKESDVYSFGVVLFEVLCGRLCYDISLRPLVGLVREYHEQNKISELVYSNIRDEISKSSLTLFVDIAYQCLNRKREDRPLMKQIVNALERALDIQQCFIQPNHWMTHATVLPSAQVVGNAFVEHYYNMLHESPELVHKYYQDSSILSRPDANGLMSSVTTMTAIDEKIQSLDYQKYKAEIKSVDAQDSHQAGVIVLVTGCLTGKDNVKRKFAQTFFLAPQEKGYFVQNDVFRYVEENEPVEKTSTADDLGVQSSGLQK